MEYYNIHQLVYTKLNPGDSPFDKKDFHTAFYPLDILNNTDVLLAETHIYIPTSVDFSAKQVVYFREHKNETILFVYDIRLLTGEVDSMGRGGIFICHIFMFPQALWQQLPWPDKLLELVEDYRYQSRSELLNNSFIDRKTGHMKPIQLPAEKVNSLDKSLPKLESAYEGKVLLHLNEAQVRENKDQKFIFAAREDAARKLFNKLICYLPNNQKVNIGWDTMYDGGRMMDYNKFFVAYQEKAPRGGSGESLFHLSGNKIELAKDFKSSFEQSPYLKWVTGCYHSIRSHTYIEEAYKFSEAILNKEKFDLSDTWNLDCFAKVNAELVGKLFIQKCKKEFKRTLRKELKKIVTPKDQILFFYDSLELIKFSDYLLNIIENRKVAARKLKNSIPAKYINNNAILILIEQLWKTGKFEFEQFNNLSDRQKLQLNQYILKSSILKKDWYLNLIVNDKTLINYYTRQYAKPKKIIKLLHKIRHLNESQLSGLGFDLSDIRKIFYFKMKHVSAKIKNTFTKKKNE